MNPLWSSSYYLGLAYTGIVSLVSTLSGWVIPATILSVKFNPNNFYQFAGFALSCVFSIVGIVLMGVTLVRAYRQFMEALITRDDRRVQIMAFVSFVLVVWIIHSIISFLQNIAQYSLEGMFYSTDNKRASIGNQNGIIGRIW